MGPLAFVYELQRAGRHFLAWQKTQLLARGITLGPGPWRWGLISFWIVLSLGLTIGFLRATPRLVPTPFMPQSMTTSVASSRLEQAWASLNFGHDNTVKTGMIETGQTALSLFAHLGIHDDQAWRTIITHRQAYPFAYPQPGQYYQATVAPNGTLMRLDLLMESISENASSITSLIREGAILKVQWQPLVYTTQTVTVHGSFAKNWRQTFQTYGVPREFMPMLTSIFDGPDNPLENTPAKTQFALIYDKKFLGDHFVRLGRILGIVLQKPDGTRYEAYWFNPTDSAGNYFTPSGESARQTFMRIPLDVVDVSSEFAALRRHPVTGELRPHNGTDFRAPEGSRIFAAANGVVVRKTFQRGYGNYIQIDHGRNRETIYAHMSRFNSKIQAGQRVKKGDLIGYVGHTGLATGPHLHYELKINGIQVNPQTVDIPDTENLSQFQMAQFKSQFEPIQQALYQALHWGEPHPALPHQPMTDDDEPSINPSQVQPTSPQPTSQPAHKD